MSVLTQIRSWFSRNRVAVAAHFEGARFSRDRSWLPGLTQSAIQDITSGDRLELTRRARYFEKNSPLFQQILDLIEQNVVGTGVNPTPSSSDAEYNKKALAAWNDWCTYADLTSRQHLYTLESIIARAQACDGEIFCWLTHGDSGRPRLQLIESHRVRSAKLPHDVASQYSHLIDIDGVLIDAQGRPQFYIVQNDIGAGDTARAGSVAIIPADQVIHFFEPSRASQYRGITLFHAAIVPLHDIDDLQRYEMIAAKDAASRANVVYTENGEAPTNGGELIGRKQRTAVDDGGKDVDRKVYYETAFGGKTVVLKRGDKWEQGESLRPSAAMREFWEYLTEQVCRAVGISFAAVKNYQGWGGAALRAAVISDNRFFDVRTAVLTAGLQRIFEHVIGWHNGQGLLGKPPADWKKCRWQSPRRASVDIGRESAAMLNELRSGTRTFRDVLGEQGLDWRETLTQRAEEEAFIDQLSTMFAVDRTRISAMNPNERTPPIAEPVTAVQAHAADSILAFSISQPFGCADDPAVAVQTEFVWMPIGEHEISAGRLGGGTFRGTVKCDEAGFRAVLSDFRAILASGQRVWIDFNHEDAAAAAWVKSFSWDAARGIICHVEWTPDGEQSLRAKRFYSFSPAFLVSKDTGRVAGLVYGHAAGGLVNAPAFGSAMPALIAARLSGSDSHINPASGGSPENPNLPMNKEMLLKILAALAVTPPADATDQQLIELVAKHAANAKPGSEVEKLTTQLNEAVAAKNKAEADLVTANKAKDEAVTAAAAKPATPTIVVVSPGVGELENVAASRVTSKPKAFEAIKAMMKETDSAKRGGIYCRELRDFVRTTPNVAEVLAANSFGTVTSDLIVLRSLDLLKLNFPVLDRVTTDFSAGTVPLQGQAIKSRIISIPSVVTYNDTTGWAASDATTTDVPVTIGQPVGVMIALNSTELAGTSRDLFAEQVEASHYALGKNMVDALYAIITQANFSGAAKRTIKALASFTRSDVVDMGTALGKRGVGLDRTLLLNSDYFGALSKDLVAIGNAALVDRSILERRVLPMLHNFSVVEASNLPANAFTSTTGTLQGFGFTKDALVIATRVPEDYTRALPGATHGSVSVVTNPDTGISVQKVDFVDHILGKAYSRIAMSYGVAKGQVNSGQCLTET